MADINVMIGQVMENPIFWVMGAVVVFLVLGQRYGWFSKAFGRKEFKGEPLKDTLLRDLKPRLKKHGKKGKGAILMQHYHNFGKVKKFCEGNVEYWIRKPGNPKPKEKAEFDKKGVDITYFLVGGNAWLSWIPYIGQNYEPDYYVLKTEFVKFNPETKTFDVDMGVHLFPYGEIWVSDKQTAKYLTELEARRTQEFEAETNVNTLKRWTYYDSQKAGRIVTMEKDVQLDQDRWDHTRETHED